jgi:hypothetical protein
MKDLSTAAGALRQSDLDLLVREFGSTFGRDAIVGVFQEAIGEFADVPFKQYVPLFAYRFARERLIGMRARSVVGTDIAADGSRAA